MRNRSALVLKIICACLVAWLAWEVVKVGRDINPLAKVTIPDVPSLPTDTNASPAVANNPPGKPGTNAMGAATNTNGPAIAGVVSTNGPAVTGDTNGPAIAGDSNAVPRKRVRRAGTNVTAVAAASASTNNTGATTVAAETNLAAATNMAAATNLSVVTNLVMNAPTNGGIAIETNASMAVTTNAAQSNAMQAMVAAMSLTNASGSNVSMVLPTNGIVAGTNVRVAKMSGTNVMADSARTNLTNGAMARAHGARPPDAAMAAMMGGRGGAKPAAPLAPEIQARVDRVYESEIFAPVMHPMPMALLGIAGKSAFLRAPSGQTGLVKEGEDLGDIKLLRIGINRVLVEQDGKKQELMIFAGLGGESLLTKTNDSSNEPTKN